MDLPLSGITVVELGHSVAAPFCGQILGDLGARVIKVENPGAGDDARAWGPPFWHGSSATFQSLNRNKQSVTADLKDPAQNARLRAFIVGEADVVVQNLRPGGVKRFGLDDALCRENPRLVYCNLGAFGNAGPWKDKPGYDPLMQAFGGIMSVTGEPGAAPVRVGPSIIDMGAGLWSAIGILAALERRHHTGKGGVVDTSLFETSLSWMTVPIAMALASGREPGRSGSEAAMIVPYKAYRAADRYLVIAAGNDALFRKLCGALGRDEWGEDPRFASNAERVANREVLNALIEGIVATANADEWVDRLDRVGVPSAPMQGVTEVLAHAQTRAVDMVRPLADGSMSLVSLPLRFDGERLPFRAAPPALGADNDSVFSPIAAEVRT